MKGIAQTTAQASCETASQTMSLRYFLFVFLSLCLLPSDALTQQNRLEEALFVSLPVSVAAANEQEGQAKAVRLALRTTFAEVLRRFVKDEAGGEALARNLSEKQIRALGESLFIETASFEDGTLTGQASVRFILEKLFARLNKEGLQVSYSIAPSFVLIPVFVLDGNTRLWPPQNLWLSAWKAESAEKSWLVPITPIEASAIERLTVLDTIEDLQSLQAALLTKRYRAEGIVLLTATVKRDTEPSSVLTLIVSGRLQQQGFPSDLPPFSVAQDEQSTPANPSDALIALLAQARIETLYRLNRLWKEKTAHAAKRRRLRIIAELRSREEWTTVKSLLAATPELVDYGLRSLSDRRAHVVAYHYGPPSLLQAALERKRLSVSNLEGNDLTIRLVAVAP